MKISVFFQKKQCDILSQLGNARVNRLVEKGPPTTDDEEGETRLKMLTTKMKANMMHNATKQSKKLVPGYSR